MPKQISNPGVDREGLYQCSQCHRRYHRTEHLTRHVRSHTKQRPYSCELCGKAFGRLDILRRHEATHAEDPGAGSRLPQSHSTIDRVSQACKLCAATKSKCSEQKPCHRCVNKGLQCEYTRDPDEDVVHDQSLLDRDQGRDRECGDERDNASSKSVGSVPAEVGADEQTLPLPSTSASVPVGQLQMDCLGASLDARSPLPTFMNPMDFLSIQEPSTNFSLGPGWDMAAADFSYLQAQFDMTGSDTLAMVPEDMQTGSNMTSSSGRSRETISVTGAWVPQISENREMERPNLAADEESLQIPTLNKGIDTPASRMSLSAVSRNNIVRMILNTTSRANAAEILGSFPSIRTIDTLLDLYWKHWETARINDFVHLPTLQLEDQRPELLGSMIAIGAIKAGSTVARKFGFAMQEVVWASTFRNWEMNNTDFQDISLAQGFLLQQHLAFFSGVGRKIAFAEACSKCVQVLIKNGGHLQGAKEARDPELVHLANSDAPALEAAWLRWIVHESQRRLVYAAYIMDSHVSMTYSTQLISSYLDMNVQFPAPRRLWRAETSTHWRDEMLLLQKTPKPQQTLCLRRLMSNPTLVSTHHHQVDMDFAITGFLAGLWALIRECHQLSSISGHFGTWSTMILSSRRMELSSTLRLFVSQLEVAGLENSPGMELLFEVLATHAFISTDNLVLRDLVLPRLHSKATIPKPPDGPQPVSNVEQRSALWRAGRTVRAAFRCSPGVLCDVYATALFQAAVFLWWHGVVSARQMTEDSICDRGTPGVCILDSDDSHEHQMLSSHVRLALLGPFSDPIPLEDSFGLMERIKGIFEHNWRDQKMPPGAEEICHSLSDIGKASHSDGLELGDDYLSPGEAPQIP